jgi:hypothetical protein
MGEDEANVTSSLVMMSSRDVHRNILTPKDMASIHLCARIANKIRMAPPSSRCI